MTTHSTTEPDRTEVAPTVVDPAEVSTAAAPTSSTVAPPEPSPPEPSGPDLHIAHDPLASVCAGPGVTFDSDAYWPSFAVPRRERAALDDAFEGAVERLDQDDHCDTLVLTSSALLSIVCWQGGDEGEPPHATASIAIALGDGAPRAVSARDQLTTSTDLAALFQAACLAQPDDGSDPDAERCAALRDDFAFWARGLALGPRGLLLIDDVIPDEHRPFEGPLEVPYRVVVDQVAPGSALSRYLASCPDALEP